MRSPVLLLVLVALTGCPKTAAPPAPDAGRAATFWPWFAQNEPRLASTVKANPAAVMDEIQRHLWEQEPKLLVELSVMPEPGRPHGLVISAGGDAALFPAVQRLVASAPTLGSFELIAFRPRHDPELDLTVDGRKVSPGDFLFRETGRHGGKVDVELAIEGLTPANHDVLVRAAFMLIDAVLGEYDAELRVGNIEFTPAPDPPTGAHRPLDELAKTVDAMK